MHGSSMRAALDAQMQKTLFFLPFELVNDQTSINEAWAPYTRPIALWDTCPSSMISCRCCVMILSALFHYK
ncbi:hypothetical protein HanIR_Chr12g0566081 [Helianthus annuus]|nr:hypothetical protein HanIR_Chr12g0566081 [Helianthus annuus]